MLSVDSGDAFAFNFLQKIKANAFTFMFEKCFMNHISRKKVNAFAFIFEKK